MDPKSINIFGRQKLGFFFTTGNPDNAKDEHGIFAELTKLIAQRLKESKIRAVNIHEHWSDVYKLAEDVDAKLDELCKMVPPSQTVFKPIVEPNASFAWSLSLVIASIGQ